MLLLSLADARDYGHIFIAPHLDDAVLSCGGMIARHASRGAQVLVVTLCAGVPDPSVPLSPFAEYLHQAWSLGNDPLALRQNEDARALARLGIDGLHLNQLDAIYRDPAYSSREAIFGTLQPNDPLVAFTAEALQTLRIQNPTATLYLPLAVGQHVDHQAAFAAHVQAADAAIAFYEDFPYVAKPDALAQRMAGLTEQFIESVVALDEADLARKLSAITEYHSQLGELFPNEPMDAVVTAYAASVGDDEHPSERLWLLTS